MGSFTHKYPRLLKRSLIALLAALNISAFGWAQTEPAKASAEQHFRIGEKLSYTISFDKMSGVGTAEMYVASKGKLAGVDVVELRSRARTVDLVNAAFLPVDETRTVYADPNTGLPLYISKTSNVGMPKETIANYLREASTNYDILTLIYHARETGGSGTFNFVDGEQVHTATFLPSGTATISTEAGPYETTISSVQSSFFTVYGITNFQIYFSTDAAHIPVEFRFRNARGPFRATLTAVTLPDPPVTPLTAIVATASPTPAAVPSPIRPTRPTPTPTPKYVENVPLSPELGFELGEKLQYRLSAAGKPIGILALNVRERKLFEKADSLLLTATIVGVEPGVTVIHPGDSMSVQVDPETLAPMWYESRFPGGLSGLNQTVTLDRDTGDIKFAGKNVDSPIGTHTVLSLIYAMRSFNLKPSQNRNSPVNDTRVAVFWDTQPYIFTLRPSAPAEITTLDGRKQAAQLIAVKTENSVLDAMSPKVWLSADSRVPLKFSVGAYTADLMVQPALTGE